MSGEAILEKIVIPMVATFAGAFLAFRYQHTIEKRRDKRTIVQSLMIFRNVGADELEWIKAMNAVEIVFHDNERVRQLWAKYLEYTSDMEKFKQSRHIDVYYEMLYEMCRDCGYNQITESDLRQFYSPNALSKHYHNPASLEKPIDLNEPPYPQLLEEISQQGLA
jgi:hypothetical protein